MPHVFQDIGIASQIGAYSDAAQVASGARWLVTSGAPGLAKDGAGIPSTIEAQAELAWQHVVEMLARAEMTIADIVKVTQYLKRPDDIKAYAAVRSKYLGDARPASMLTVVSQLVWREMLVEIEILAAKVG